MTLLMLTVWGILVTFVFGFSLGFYLSRYVFRLSTNAAVISSTVIFGTTITIVTFLIMLLMVWPPFFPI